MVKQGTRGMCDFDDFLQLTILKTEQKENWLAKKERMKKQMEDTCRKYGASLNFSAPRTNLLYDKKDNILYCVNPKVKEPFYSSALNEPQEVCDLNMDTLKVETCKGE